MTVGSLTHLYSNENTIFCLNPQITHFKSVFRKYTKFVMTDYHHTSIDNDTFSDSRTDMIFHFPPAGDLLSKVSLQIELNEPSDISRCTKFPNNIGTALFKNIIFKYDNLEIDDINSEYINFTSMLNNPKSLNSIYDITTTNELVCNNGNNYQRMALSGGVFNGDLGDSISIKKMKSIVPIPFSFTKNVGTAFPLFLLTKKDLSIYIKSSDKNSTSNLFATNANINKTILEKFKFSLIFKYIYLSEDEKNRFKSSPQEYLLEKVKYNSNHLRLNGKINIDFRYVVPNLPVKCIYLVNKSASGVGPGKIELYNKYKYQFLIRGVKLQQDSLPHEYYSKLNIIENFKGCVYDKWYYNEPVLSGNMTSINSNIAYIPLNLKNTEGPSGCINTGTNEFKMNVSTTGSDTQTDIYIYLVYYSILRISENQHLAFPYGNI